MFKGASTEWRDLPLPLECAITTLTPGEGVLVCAGISRSAHDSAKTNTCYRLVLEVEAEPEAKDDGGRDTGAHMGGGAAAILAADARAARPGAKKGGGGSKSGSSKKGGKKGGKGKKGKKAAANAANAASPTNKQRTKKKKKTAKAARHFDTVVLCEMNTGGSKGHENRSVALAGTCKVERPGEHVARVQYKVLFGSAVWAGEPSKKDDMEAAAAGDDDGDDGGGDADAVAPAQAVFGAGPRRDSFSNAGPPVTDADDRTGGDAGAGVDGEQARRICAVRLGAACSSRLVNGAAQALKGGAMLWNSLPGPGQQPVHPLRVGVATQMCGERLLLLATLGRVQNDNEKANVAFRIVVDLGTDQEQTVAHANTGGANRSHARQLASFVAHGVCEVAPGDHTVELQVPLTTTY